MEYKKFNNQYVIRIDKGEEICAKLKEVAQKENIESGNVYGGHLTEAVISGTGELVLTEIEGTVDRKFDEEIGLNLFEF